MRIAIVNNERKEAVSGLTGFCPVCGDPVIARCGNERVHHWAHRGQRRCDPWWEPETEWHRGWKNRFPLDWQEITRIDLSGERHRADVHTAHGLTIEFQYSHLRPEERVARETFYGNMVWLVHGHRLVRTVPRFLVGFNLFRQVDRGIFITPRPEEAFPASWTRSAVPVLFDFENAPEFTERTAQLSRSLWCILPRRIFGHAVVLRLSKDALVAWAHERNQLLSVEGILAQVARLLMPANAMRQARINRRRTVDMAQIARMLAIEEMKRRGRLPSSPRGRKRRRRF